MICGFLQVFFVVFLLVYHQFNSLAKESGFVGAVASATDTKAEFLKIRKILLIFMILSIMIDKNMVILSIILDKNKKVIMMLHGFLRRKRWIANF